ncbi:hypothetical protein [Stutzerimonas stutzeri]|uniref:hypothetical protein n=1 Tax=Stutzerimonas stutzeri TaxID=316 RepID=UPI00210F02E4|nr:hypothetical protein [Stutzerimonas stutzeri]MCQ4319272.1 hypothetical protein [Stutzerimonas stutzeri]
MTKGILRNADRLSLALASAIERLAREGGPMAPKDLAKFEPQRRYPTLVAVVRESTATVIDYLVEASAGDLPWDRPLR